MAQSWYLINPPQLYNGGYEKDEFNNYSTDGFSEVLDETFLSDDVILVNSDFTIKDECKVVIQNNTTDASTKLEERQILAKIGTLKKYSYVIFAERIWLITSEPSNNKIYEKAILKECKNCLKWQDVKTKEIFEYWYTAEDTTRYGAGVYSGKVITKYDKSYSIDLPLDKNTRKLHDGMRFILEFSDDIPMVFELTKYDGITGNNKNTKLLNLTLVQTVYDKSTDNIELMIADYNKNESKNISNDILCNIEYSSTSIKLSSIESYKLKFSDVDGIELKDVIYDCNVVGNFDTSDLIIEKFDNEIVIKVPNIPSLVGETFELNIITNEDIIASLNIKIDDLW